MPKAVRVAILLAVASAFGPYLVGGIRTDQVVLYGMATVLLVMAPSTSLRLRPNGVSSALFAVWGLYALIGLIGAIGAPPVSQYLRGSLLAGADNLLLPLAVMTLVWLLVTPERRDAALQLASTVTAVLTAGNGVLAVIGTRVDLALFLRPFWGSAGADGLTVAERSAQLGRLSGVFNQPAEAGLMYGVAGLAAVYAFRERQRLMYLVLTPIFIGGALCVSKVFLLGAAPLVILQLWRTSRSRIVLLLATAMAVVGASQTRLLEQWSGAPYLQRLIRPDSNTGYIDFYTASRLGERSSLNGIFAEVNARSPIVGFGARGLQAPYDNGWVEALVLAGWVGAILYTLTLLTLLALPRGLDGAQRRLAWGLALLAVIGSVGLPTLTANRAGAVLWILLALLAARTSGAGEDDERVARGAGRTTSWNKPDGKQAPRQVGRDQAIHPRERLHR